MTREQILENNKYENEILELIDNRDEYTRSDLQGIVMALVLRIRNGEPQHNDQEIYDAMTENQEAKEL
jgi:hypothetical protein